MKRHTIKTITVAAAMAAMGGLGSRPVLAQPKPAASSVDIRAAVGCVDIRKVFNDAKERQSSEGEIQDLGQNLDRVLQRLMTATAFYLTDAEITEMAKLYEKPAASLSDDDKKRINALELKAQTSNEDLTKISNTPQPTDAQKARLQQLTADREKGEAVLQRIQNDYQTRLRNRESQLTAKITDNMKAAIAKVAQEKNLALVFDSALAVYAANDITADVIKQLNAGK